MDCRTLSVDCGHIVEYLFCKIIIDRFIEMIKFYYKNGVSVLGMFRALLQFFGDLSNLIPIHMIFKSVQCIPKNTLFGVEFDTNTHENQESPIQPKQYPVWCEFWAAGVIAP